MKRETHAKQRAVAQLTEFNSKMAGFFARPDNLEWQRSLHIRLAILEIPT
jgi:hypothetical protein